MRILFYIPNSTVVHGGISVILDIIDVLNANNIEAVALYDRPDFEYDKYIIKAPRLWSPLTRRPRFNSNQKSIVKRIHEYILDLNRKPSGNSKKCPEWKIEIDDVVVVPEYASDWMPDRLPQGVPLVLFNQNPFALFQAYNRLGFDRDKFVESISTSEACFTGDQVVLGADSKRIPLFISKEIFAYKKEKSFQVAYMPRRRSQDSNTLIKALKETKGLEDVPFVPIDGASNSEAARILRESLFFLSFSEREGFGLPAAEAMATGALVIGYSGVGGDEFFDKSTGFRVPEDNLMKFYIEAVSIIGGYRANKKSLDNKRKHASEIILRKYSRAKFEVEVVRVFSEIARSIMGQP